MRYDSMLILAFIQKGVGIRPYDALATATGL